MEERRRLTLEEIDERHPELIAALREHPHVGWLLVRSAERGPLVLGGGGERYLARRHASRARTRWPTSRRPRAEHLLRTDGFEHVADIMVGSFYDPELDEGCAFEELISFHGGLGGPQTRPFILHPERLRVPAEPMHRRGRGARAALGWRRELNGAAGARVDGEPMIRGRLRRHASSEARAESRRTSTSRSTRAS